VSVPLRSGLVHWPGDPEVSISRISSIEDGDECNVSTISMSAHTGTHMDAPLHFLANGAGLDRLPLDAVIGPARVIAIRDPRSVTAAELARHRIRRGERVLFKTQGAAARWKRGTFDEDYVYVSLDAARFLAARGVRVVGVDYLSVGGFLEDSAETHRTLLSAGIWIIEGLDLARIATGRYDMVCLPLRIAGGDGAPARVALRRRALGRAAGSSE
jgi:arylformamidase